MKLVVSVLTLRRADTRVLHAAAADGDALYSCLIEALPAPEADPSSVPPRLRGGEEEEEDSGEEGREKRSKAHQRFSISSELVIKNPYHQQGPGAEPVTGSISTQSFSHLDSFLGNI